MSKKVAGYVHGSARHPSLRRRRHRRVTELSYNRGARGDVAAPIVRRSSPGTGGPSRIDIMIRFIFDRLACSSRPSSASPSSPSRSSACCPAIPILAAGRRARHRAGALRRDAQRAVRLRPAALAAVLRLSAASCCTAISASRSPPSGRCSSEFLTLFPGDDRAVALRHAVRHRPRHPGRHHRRGQARLWLRPDA